MKPLDTAVITVGERRLSGADRLLTLLSPDHGRIRAVARGACLPNNEIGGALAPFGVARVILSPGRGLFRVESADRVSTFGRLQADLSRTLGAGLICAWARSLSREPEGAAVYRLLHRCLVALDRDETSVAAVVARFIWRMAVLSGVGPVLSRCVHCQSTGNLTGIRFDPGGGICANCRIGNDITLPPSAWRALSAVSDSAREPWRTVPEETARRLVALGQGYLRHHFGARLPNG